MYVGDCKSVGMSVDLYMHSCIYFISLCICVYLCVSGPLINIGSLCIKIGGGGFLQLCYMIENVIIPRGDMFFQRFRREGENKREW